LARRTTTKNLCKLYLFSTTDFCFREQPRWRRTESRTAFNSRLLPLQFRQKMQLQSRRYFANLLSSCVPARTWNKSALSVTDTNQYRCTYLQLMSPHDFLFASSFLAQHTCLLPLSRSSGRAFYFLLSKCTKTADPGRITTRIIIVEAVTIRGCIRSNGPTRLRIGTGVMRRKFRMQYSVVVRTGQSRTRKFRSVSIIEVNEVRSETPRAGEGRDRINPWRIIVVRTETRMIRGSKRSKD